MSLFGDRRPRRTTTVPLDSDEGIRAAYNAHGSELYRFAQRQLGDSGAAQDAVQETFLRAWRRAEAFDPDVGELRTWLFAIVRNVVIDESRRQRVRPWQRQVAEVDERSVPTGTDGGGQTFEDGLLQSWTVEEALRRIGEDHRRVLVEVHLRGRPQDEVAAELQIPVGTVRSRVFYGLKALRLALEEMGVQP